MPASIKKSYTCALYSSRLYQLITVACRTGILLFILIYIIASRYYPGGSDYDRFAKGFDWLHNYWCELLAANAKSGEPNAASPIAIGAFIVLDLVLLLCWLQASFLYRRDQFAGRSIIICGIMSCISLAFMSSPSHDLVINIAGGFGLVALVLTMAGLLKRKYYFSFILGLICVFLFFLNTYIYYTRTWFDSLAVVQKISFAAFLWWYWIVAGIAKPANIKSPPLQGNDGQVY